MRGRLRLSIEYCSFLNSHHLKVVYLLYREAGLGATLVEGGPMVEVEEEVVSGKTDFGVGTSALLLHLAGGDDLVVLGQIF
jgi:ABC-type nitrate/sulfonate/bicarbonate transport system substrate-binding protein